MGRFWVFILVNKRWLFASASLHWMRWRLRLMIDPLIYLTGPGFIFSVDIQLLAVGFALYVELPKLNSEKRA